MMELNKWIDAQKKFIVIDCPVWKQMNEGYDNIVNDNVGNVHVLARLVRIDTANALSTWELSPDAFIDPGDVSSVLCFTIERKQKLENAKKETSNIIISGKRLQRFVLLSRSDVLTTENGFPYWSMINWKLTRAYDDQQQNVHQVIAFLNDERFLLAPLNQLIGDFLFHPNFDSHDNTLTDVCFSAK